MHVTVYWVSTCWCNNIGDGLSTCWCKDMPVYPGCQLAGAITNVTVYPGCPLAGAITNLTVYLVAGARTCS